MIWIVSDSAQEVQADPARGIAVMPLPLLINRQEVHGLGKEEFYAALQDDDRQVSTSQASPAMYERLFAELTRERDSVVVITLSSTLSGTFNSARLAAMEYDNVYLVDSRQATLSQSALVARAVQLREEGLDAAQIAQALEQEKEDLVLLAAVDTLRYLKKGGRISPAAAAAGDFLGIKPVVTIDARGEVVVAGKARGTKKAHRLAVQKALEEQIDFSRPVIIGYSGLDEANAEHFRQVYEQESRQRYPDRFYALSPVLSVHAGPGAAGIGFFRKRRGDE